MQISILILNYNVKYFLDACLQSIQKAIKGRKVEIIVADNNSTDGSQNYFSGKYPKVKFLWFQENYGFARAYNLAVNHAKGEYLLILNPDTLVSETILGELKTFADRHPDFGILGGKMIDGTGTFLPESKRGVPTPLVAFSKLTRLYKLFDFRPFNTYYTGYLSEKRPGKVPVFTGAFMFLRKKTYTEVGGFDERYFMYGEDIDLSYTVLKSGRNNYYVPSAKIIHFKGESSQKDHIYYQHFLETTFQFYGKHFHSFPVQKFLMKAFFKLWLSLRLTKIKNTVTPDSNHPEVFFLGEEEHLNTLKIKYQQIKWVDDLENLPVNSLLIFDTSQIAFSRIISEMEKLKNNHIAFRFYFPKKRLLLGSDYKDHLGNATIL